MLSVNQPTKYSPWRAIALTLYALPTVAVSADVSTVGCSLQTECTGVEISLGGEFTINGVRFSDFDGLGVFLEGSVRYVPIDSTLSPGFSIVRDGGLPLFRVAGVPFSGSSDGIVFDVGSPDNRAILRRTLGASIGAYTDPVSAFIGARTFRMDTGAVELEAVCFEPPVCANSTVVDSVLSDVSGTVAIDDYSIDLVAFIGDESNPENAVIELNSATMRFEVEPPNRYYLDILSGPKWLSHDTAVAGWQTVGFDDSDWVAARAPYPNPSLPTDFIPGTMANFMWHDPAMTSDGGTGPIRAYFRYPFQLDMPTTTAAVLANIQAAVDDDYDLYVNGTLVFENHAPTAGIDMIDIVPFLQDGENVIAIEAVDGSWDNPRPRGFEWVLLDADISVPRYKQQIYTGAFGWLSSDTEQTGWQNIGFDDSAWPAARSDYPSPIAPQTLVQDTLARFVWHDPTMSSDGGTGPDEAFFRFNFNFPFDPNIVPVFAHAKVNADDDYDLYVNGQLIFRNNDAGFSDNVDEIDFADALVQGANVIAVRAADGSGDNPFPRGFERMMFEGLIASGTTSFDNDVDGDGVGNNLDNCTTSYNPAQTDTNDDGYGNTCDPDLTGDLVINAQDLGAMRLVFFTNNADADLNVDGQVNTQDLGIMRNMFFGTPGPSEIAP